MSFLFKIIFLVTPILGWGKSLNAMAKSATIELQALGASAIALGVAWSGFLFLKGGQEGKQKIFDVLAGSILILGGAAIVALLRKVVGQ